MNRGEIEKISRSLPNLIYFHHFSGTSAHYEHLSLSSDAVIMMTDGV
jgi:hypothetical protein